MKNFIVSDLHGNSNIYNSIIRYLENINKEDELNLYINGDLIDRGKDSAYMLIDIKDRIINNKGFNIKYLGGNHELMMFQALSDNFKLVELATWFSNGGGITNDTLLDLVDKEEKEKIVKFISKLDIYYKFKEKLNDKQIVLVHAKCPKIVKDICDLKIKDNNREVYKSVWTREDDLMPILNESLGNDDYFTIIGHTPVRNKKGYDYYKEYNCLNIDGGCGAYAYGYTDYNHTPLVEIDENNDRLNILTFNNNNEIIMGNYFTNGKSIKMTDEELYNKRKYIDKGIKIKRLEY
ncbi:MAG: metallophosphoesterase [Bacilli bacterium]|nr:metallophosphoesterase [Bacilli bacterium]